MQAEAFPRSFDAAVAHSRVMNSGYVADASRLYLALPPSRNLLATHLDELAGFPATADGIRSALQLLNRQVDAFPLGNQPREGSGRAAGQQAMHSAGMCLIHGRVAQVADGAKGSTARGQRAGAHDPERADSVGPRSRSAAARTRAIVRA